MEKSDILFLLIKSMTKAEKRYFRIHAEKIQISEGKDYMRLFDAVDAQKVYNEATIRKNLKAEPYGGQFRYLKSYLHRQIIKSLRNFHDEQDCELVLNNYLSEINILFKKELFKNCANTIKKAKELAEKHEKHFKLLEIIEWEGRIAFSINDVEQIEKLKHKWIQEEKSLLAKCGEINELKELRLELTPVIIRKGGFGGEEMVKRILSQKRMKKEMSSASGEMRRLAMIATCALISENYNHVFTAINKLLDFLDLHDTLKDEYINLYQSALLDLVHTSLKEKKITTAEQLVEKAKNLNAQRFDRLTVKNKMRIPYFEACLLLARGEFMQAFNQVHKIDDVIASHNKKLDTVAEFVICQLYFNIYFCNRDFKRAQYYVQQIINYDNAEIRSDFQSSARIVNLILQYEQQEYEHLGYVLQSTYRYLLKKQRLLKPEAILLGFIRKSSKFTSEKQTLLALKEFKEQIEPFLGQLFLLSFPLIEWINSKLQKRSLEEIVKERYFLATEEEPESISKIA